MDPRMSVRAPLATIGGRPYSIPPTVSAPGGALRRPSRRSTGIPSCLPRYLRRIERAVFRELRVRPSFFRQPACEARIRPLEEQGAVAPGVQAGARVHPRDLTLATRLEEQQRG